jgi:hypothetical protein
MILLGSKVGFICRPILDWSTCHNSVDGLHAAWWWQHSCKNHLLCIWKRLEVDLRNVKTLKHVNRELDEANKICKDNNHTKFGGDQISGVHSAGVLK